MSQVFAIWTVSPDTGEATWFGYSYNKDAAKLRVDTLAMVNGYACMKVRQQPSGQWRNVYEKVG